MSKKSKLAAMKPLPKFGFFDNKSAQLKNALILCTEPPFYIGQVINLLPIELTRTNGYLAQITGYKITILITNSMDNTLPGADCEAIAHEMAAFYYKERIEPKLEFYNRFLE